MALRDPSEPRCGGFWRRLSAAALDGILVNLGVDAVMGVISGWIELPRGPFGMRLLVKLMVSWLYHAAMESSPTQATLGKMALDMRVTDYEFRRIGFGRASLRWWGKVLSGIGTLGFGYLAIAFDGRKRALHDRIAGTLIVRGTSPRVPDTGWKPTA